MFKEKRFVFQEVRLNEAQQGVKIDVKNEALPGVEKAPRPKPEQVANIPNGVPVEQPIAVLPAAPKPNEPVAAKQAQPAAAPVAAPAAASPAPAAPKQRPLAKDAFADLASQALKAGLDKGLLDGALQTYDSGIFDDKMLTDYLNKFINPQKEADKIIDDAIKPDDGNVAADPLDEIAKIGEDALSKQDDLKEDLEMAAKFEQEELTKIATNRYNSEMKILNDALAMQQELANRQMALVGEAAGIQRAEAKKMYEANQRAIELQRTKVKQAYESMQEEQRLLNKQREVRQKTANGLIYGGFGSIAANRNIEDTIMRGERELSKLKQEAVNADTEIQSEIIDLNQTYEIDLRKISQWQAEQEVEIYGELQSYVQKIMADKLMAGVEKSEAISRATINYNNKYAEIQATSVQAQYDLSLEIFDRTQALRESMKKESRAEQEFAWKVEDREREKSLADFDMLIGNYASKNWDELPLEVTSRMEELADNLNMPDSFAKSAFEIYKEAQQTKEPPEFKFFTDNSGNVTAVSYDLKNDSWSSVGLGQIDGGEIGQWKSVKDDDGNIVLYNDQTGEKRGGSAFTGGAKGSPADALNVPDGSIGGQCGRFVNNYTGLGLGDDYDDKMNKMDPNITEPQPGDVFVMPYSWTGHTGFIVSIRNGKATVKHSNWDLNEKVSTNVIDVSDMTGFWRPGGTKEKTEDKKKDEEEEDEEGFVSWDDI